MSVAVCALLWGICSVATVPEYVIMSFVCGVTALIRRTLGTWRSLQVIQAVCEDPQDTTELYLLYANQTEDDILLRPKLEDMAAANPRLHVWHTLAHPPAGWPFSAGFVTEQMLRQRLAPAADCALVALCGPPAMVDVACLPALDRMGWKKDNIVIF